MLVRRRRVHVIGRVPVEGLASRIGNAWRLPWLSWSIWELQPKALLTPNVDNRAIAGPEAGCQTVADCSPP